ncbi:hypothetical protein [Desulfovibrio inopinatus]|uniref:hypothetical protein n=1 Tax=Desulfovibrio inopinatus TaxID=102109 RepID=UPI0004080B6C|nr:hypothetical protein [Desulfovibrio inopinatus]
MNILYSPECATEYGDFGMDIPHYGDRAERILAAVKPPKDMVTGFDEHCISREDMLRIHDAAYVDALFSETPDAALHGVYELYDENGQPNRFHPESAKSTMRELAMKGRFNTAATYAGCIDALHSGFTYVLAGGMHHAMRAGGRGFCQVNDIAIALERCRAEGHIRTAWVVDVDAHRGDGTAEIFLGRDDIRTLSIHMAHGWPLDTPALDEQGHLQKCRYPSTVDIPIVAGGEAHYVPALAQGMLLLESLSMQKPDLVVVVNGADPYEYDALESARLMQLSALQMLSRDRLIHQFFAVRKIPQVWLLSGGYGPHAHEPVVNFLKEMVEKNTSRDAK